MIVVFWILFSIFIGVWADKRHSNGISMFFVSLIFSPIIGFIIVALPKSNEETIMKDKNMKKCPECAELIKAEAIKCRYCGFQFGKDISKQSSSDEIKEYTVLSRGTNSELVKDLQIKLNTKVGCNLNIDGIFGEQVFKQVINFQNMNKLNPDGIVGPDTWNKLNT